MRAGLGSEDTNGTGFASGDAPWEVSLLSGPESLEASSRLPETQLSAQGDCHQTVTEGLAPASLEATQISFWGGQGLLESPNLPNKSVRA